MERSSKTSTFLFILVLVMAGVIYYLTNQPENTPSTIVTTDTSSGTQVADAKNNPPQPSSVQSDNTTQPTDNSNSSPPADTSAPTTKKTVPTNVNIEPVAYTGYGHEASKPLKLVQNTSTTCTTDPSVECSLSFTNQSNGTTINFTAQTTDGTGVTRWEWQGSDVGSGTWSVIAKAGDKTSTAETIYIN